LILNNGGQAPQHLIQRGNNRQACFYADEDYASYLSWLKEYADKTGCIVHAYVLMTNHVHLLVSTEKADAIAAMMKALGQRYVQYINRTYHRSGPLWEGRYRSCPIQSRNLLICLPALH
jgi:putative transposase